jgi:hypothetical protein
VSDLDRLLAQVEELKKLATRPDDSWMDSMSTEELQALGKRVRRVADGLSGLQSQLTSGASRPGSPRPPQVAQRSGAGPLGNLVKKDAGSTSRSQWSPPAAKPAAPSPFPGAASNDLSNPMSRRRVGGAATPREAPPAPRGGVPPQRVPPWQKKPGGETPPPRGRNRPTF